MRPVRQPTPEVADWYVFRSGKAEGPYSKLQLWEVQKITARTKVRQGEADWQHAGEIAELAKYLSEKQDVHSQQSASQRQQQDFLSSLGTGLTATRVIQVLARETWVSRRRKAWIKHSRLP